MKIDKQKLSPMMKKYLETKEEYSDCILFYRLGDFYEMFFDDALLASKVLNIALTGKSCGLEERAPMCGVPFHSVDSYIAKMVEDGYKVAIAEQVEDPATANGLVRREVIKIVTPGTLLETDDGESSNSYLMSIYSNESDDIGVAYYDIKTGELNASKISKINLKDEVSKICPKEIISNSQDIISDLEMISKLARIYLNNVVDDALMDEGILLERFDDEYLATNNIKDDEILTKSISMVLNYIKITQMIETSNINSVNIQRNSDFMKLDLFTRVNLELTETIRGRNKVGSLLKVLDFTSTPMGARMLKKHIEQPLTNIRIIEDRLSIVDELFNNFVLRTDLKSYFSKIYDLERICSKIAYERVTPKDLVYLKNSIEVIPKVIEIINLSDSNRLKQKISKLDPLIDIWELIERSILEEPSNNIKDGNIIKSEYSSELADLREISSNGAYLVQEIEKKEKELTGAKTLKVGYNKVFGYYIEITKVALTQA
ncbi:MAG: DNA mismatch repair protein MutS, partial [Peptostreptococcus porci]|nr:DNA mismatch repair protein MutS [Peptostreptococcus porci]